MRFDLLIVGLWLAWLVSWWAAAPWSNKTEKRAGIGAELKHRVPTIAGFVLFAIPAHGYQGRLRLWHVSWAEAWGCVLLVALGFAFCWWARLHLGRLWSGTITKKEGHHLVDTGPYGIVRHPIYTGLLLSVFGTMLAKGTVPGVAGFALIVLGLWIKARLEEGWLRGELGADVYDDYRRRVPMLVPLAKWG